MCLIYCTMYGIHYAIYCLLHIVSSVCNIIGALTSIDYKVVNSHI